MRFTFIHAADLHIDSPLESLGAKDPEIAKLFARAGRAAVEALISETLASEARFLVISGDIFDGDWRDVSTGHFFVRQLGELHRRGVPVFIVKGNHDAEGVITGNLTYPSSAHIFSSLRAETRFLEDLRVALHGRSFTHKRPAEDFVTTYPARREGWLNIGVLHTGLDGVRGHNPYAPCTIADLARHGYDYWALGHIHAAEIVACDPYVVFPGNLQGRSPRETGPKGAMRVTVEDGRVVAVEPLILDAARWAHESVDMSGVADEAEAQDRIAKAISSAHAGADGRPLALRISLTGETPAHGKLLARREVIEADARARAFGIASDCWVERVKILTRAAPERPLGLEADALDVDALISEAAADPEFLALVADLQRSIGEKLPGALQGEWKLDDAAALARDFLKGERA